MAFPISTISSVTQRLILPKIWDNIFPSNAFTVRTIKRARFLEATDGVIRFPVMLAKNANAISYVYGQALPTTIQETSTAGEVSIAFYNSPISLPGPDLIQNQGKGQIINLLKGEVYNAEKSLKDVMGTDIFSANATGTGFIGTQVEIDDATSAATYAGINRNTYTTWKSYLVNGSAGALSLQSVQNVYLNASIDESFPTLMVMPYSGVVKLWGLTQPQQVFGSEDTYVIGARNFTFGNAPVVPDPHCLSTAAYLINENYFHMYINQNRNFAFIPFQAPSNQDAYIAHIRFYGQIICEAPRLQGVLWNYNFSL